jgi:lycopene cyclase domain-containing protein
MTYFTFLFIFLCLPILFLSIVAYRDARRGLRLPDSRQGFLFGAALLLHILVAVAYTTPWDNYLVATGVWYYNPELVTGIRIGWVPIEEYAFFVLQTIMTGLLLLALSRRLPAERLEEHPSGWITRFLPVILLGSLWVWVLLRFASGWESGTYFSLIVLWALPPIMLQFAFGGDTLWRERKLVGSTLLLATLYLSITDSLAIGSGVWTIAPGQSFQIFLAEVLPLEELLFFLVTNCLIVFGITLFLAKESRIRLRKMAGKNVMEYS